MMCYFNGDFMDKRIECVMLERKQEVAFVQWKNYRIKGTEWDFMKKSKGDPLGGGGRHKGS